MLLLVVECHVGEAKSEVQELTEKMKMKMGKPYLMTYASTHRFFRG